MPPLEDSREGAGTRFLLSLDLLLEKLRLYPKLAPVFNPPVRRLLLGNSGYGDFYTIEARGIIIQAIMHLRQSPESIREKIRRLLDLR